MNKKIIIGIIIILAIVIGGFAVYTYAYSGNFGSSSIEIPEGFHIDKKYGHGLAITNKNNTTKYLIKEYYNYTIDKIEGECFSKYKENDTVVNGTYTVKDVPVRTTTLKNSKNHTVHKYYFYEKNNKVYQLFTTGAKNSTAVEQIISSTGNNTLF